MNRENFERVKAAILANPDSFNMRNWALHDNESPCGTVGCIAGFCDWLMALDGRKRTAFTPDGRINEPQMERREKLVQRNAIQFLGITPEEGDRIFLRDDWPLHLEGEYCAANTKQRRAEIAVRRLDYFMENGL